METGRSSSVYSAYSSVRSMPRTRPSDDTISVTTSPQPPLRLTSRRKAVSVMPAMGARATGSVSSMEPIRVIVSSVRCAWGPAARGLPAVALAKAGARVSVAALAGGRRFHLGGALNVVHLVVVVVLPLDNRLRQQLLDELVRFDLHPAV